MKEKFLKLVEEVSKTGVAQKLRNCTTADEMQGVCDEFVYDNKELINKIEAWEHKAFVKKEGIFYREDFLFGEGEEVKNPIEIAIVIHFLPSLSEKELFESWEDLYCALHRMNEEFASAIADIAWGKYIREITIKDIFDYIKD